jgi:hypothetical protein
MWSRYCLCAFAIFSCAAGAAVSDSKAPYPAMASFSQYLLPNEADEIALAKSAAPPSIADKAEVLTLTAHGYKTAVKGTNGFVCLVQRSWAAGFADAEFWNPNLRAPICHNPAAARTVHPPYIERTAWVLAGVSKSEMIDRTRAELLAKKMVLPEAGSMSYMMSKHSHLHDADGHWHPHLMFYFLKTDAAAWGANLEGSPVLADDAPMVPDQAKTEPFTTFFIPVTHWSDGTSEN